MAAVLNSAAGATPAVGVKPPKERSSRYHFIDILRGLAVLFMIETHTVNALIAPGLERGAFHTALTFINGLVAPAFLFCAGLGFAVAASRRRGTGASTSGMSRSVVKKCLFIMLVGYSMHVPVFSLGAILDAPAEVRNTLFQVDILQVISASLLTILGVVVVARSPRTALLVSGSLGVIILFSAALAGGTPVFDGWGDRLPVVLRSYFSRELSPLFTLVPWAVYLFAGFVLGTLFLDHTMWRGRTATSAGAPGADRAAEEGVIRRFTLLALGLLVLMSFVAPFTVRLYEGDAFWYWSAEYVIIRLSAVVLLMCLLWYLGRRGEGPAGRALALFGRESLPVYYIHLIIVYGKDFEWSFVRSFPRGMGYPACFAMAIGLVVAMYLFARGWNLVKKTYPRTAVVAVRTLVAGSVLTFLLT